MTSAPTYIPDVHSNASPPRFSSFHGKDWELRDVVAGYGCIDLFVEVAFCPYSFCSESFCSESFCSKSFCSCSLLLV